MVAVEERAELHKTIWRIANDLCGSVDGRDFKSDVLGFLFYRHISENLADCVNARSVKRFWQKAEASMKRELLTTQL